MIEYHYLFKKTNGDSDNAQYLVPFNTSGTEHQPHSPISVLYIITIDIKTKVLYKNCIGFNLIVFFKINTKMN